MADFDGVLFGNQAALAQILIEYKREDLYSRIGKFPDEAKRGFFDQITRRYLAYTHQDDLAAYIKQNSVPSYITIVEELLSKNPYDGFHPSVPNNPKFQNFSDSVHRYLSNVMPEAYMHKPCVHEHVHGVLTAYPKLISKLVDQQNTDSHNIKLFEIFGDIGYKYGGQSLYAHVVIRVPKYYPEHRPHVMLVCPDKLAIIPNHLHVAPNGFVYHPYLRDWDVRESNLIKLISHLCVEFTCQAPLFNINLGVQLHLDEIQFIKILINYGQMHLYAGIEALKPPEQRSLINKITRKYRSAANIRSDKKTLAAYVNYVAKLLNLQPNIEGTENVENL